MRKITNPHSVAKTGKRKDLENRFFRSNTEANYARYLNFIGIKWEYEVKEFYFDGIRKGGVSYKPDFYLTEEDRWIEVKGWFDSKSVTKLKRFRKYYPQEFEKLTLVVQSKKGVAMAIDIGIPYEDYREIKRKVGRMIEGWE